MDFLLFSAISWSQWQRPLQTLADLPDYSLIWKSESDEKDSISKHFNKNIQHGVDKSVLQIPFNFLKDNGQR